MRAKKISILLAFVIVVVGLVVYFSASPERSSLFYTGKAFADASSVQSDSVIATYKGYEVKQSVFEYEKKNMEALANGEKVSDQQVVEHLLVNMIMLDEAERLGLTITDDEVAMFLNEQHANYDNYEDYRAFIDDFCAGANITIDDYFSIIEEQIPSVILRQKLRDHLGEEYCKEHNLKFTKLNPPQEMQDYVDKYLNNLLNVYSEKIRYY